MIRHPLARTPSAQPSNAAWYAKLSYAEANASPMSAAFVDVAPSCRRSSARPNALHPSYALSYVTLRSPQNFPYFAQSSSTTAALGAGSRRPDPSLSSPPAKTSLMPALHLRLVAASGRQFPRRSQLTPTRAEAAANDDIIEARIVGAFQPPCHSEHRLIPLFPSRLLTTRATSCSTPVGAERGRVKGRWPWSVQPSTPALLPIEVWQGTVGIVAELRESSVVPDLGSLAFAYRKRVNRNASPGQVLGRSPL